MDCIFGDDDGNGKTLSLADAVSKFEKTAVAKKYDRVVFFIDDLDRLPPARAVEVLEVLKVFLNCEQCIFVLAIDYDIVVRGVREKYGSDLPIEKCRSFFDKIIQVPFKVPVSQYDTSTYMEDCFKRIGLSHPADDKLRKFYQELLLVALGNNPRSIGRMFNLLYLHSLINKEIVNDQKKELLLFAVLGMQVRPEFENGYRWLFEAGSDVVRDLRGRVHELPGTIGIPEIAQDSFAQYMTCFVEICNFINEGKDDADAAGEMLREILHASSTTSTDATEVFVKPKKYIFGGLCYEPYGEHNLRSLGKRLVVCMLENIDVESLNEIYEKYKSFLDQRGYKDEYFILFMPEKPESESSYERIALSDGRTCYVRKSWSHHTILAIDEFAIVNGVKNWSLEKVYAL